MSFLPNVKLVGIISDTHGLLRSKAIEALKGVDLIIHAGDIGSAEVLMQLSLISPVIAVRGNTDNEAFAFHLPNQTVAELDEISFYILHNLHLLDFDPVAAGFHVVVSGHTHQPCCEEQNGVLFFNPGSAGPRRFQQPITLGIVHIDGKLVQPRIIDLQ